MSFKVDELVSVASDELCLGAVRWVALSSMQTHRHKLQQLWEIREYRDGKPVETREEWRDVPAVYAAGRDRLSSEVPA